MTDSKQPSDNTGRTDAEGATITLAPAELEALIQRGVQEALREYDSRLRGAALLDRVREAETRFE